MKDQIKKTAITVCIVLGANVVYAQIPNPAGLVPPPVPGGKELPMGPKGKHRPGPARELQQLTSITGKVIEYKVNDRYAYNSFSLQKSNETVTVRFPEHMGQQLMNLAKKGEEISVKGFDETTPDGIKTFHLVSVTAGGSTLLDTPPTPPEKPLNTEAKTYSGNIAELRKDRNGMVNGLTLDNKIVVDLPPPATSQLQSLLKKGEKVEIVGFKSTAPAGVVLVADAPTVIHPQTISFNGQTYLLR